MMTSDGVFGCMAYLLRIANKNKSDVKNCFAEAQKPKPPQRQGYENLSDGSDPTVINEHKNDV